MKKNLFLGIASLIGVLLFAFNANSQTFFKVSSYYGSTNTSLLITLKPDFDFNDKLNEVGFVLQIPKVVGGNPVSLPAISVLNNLLPTTFADWVQTSESASDPDFYNFKFGATGFVSAPLLPTLTGGEIQVVEFNIPIPEAGIQLIRLAHLASGGPGTQYGVALIDGSLVDRTNYRQMFYGTGVVPSSPFPDDQTGYDNYQYVLPTRALPVKFNSFTVAKNQDNALLNWIAENETNLTDHYEIERSFTGTNFKLIGSVPAKNNGNSSNSYSSVDYNLSSFNATGKFYYRIRQVDRDGRSAYTEIRSIRLDGKTFDVNVYPNPVVNTSAVYIDLANAGQVKIKLVDAAGKVVQTAVINGTKGLNIYSLNMNKFTTGTYIVQVEAGTESKNIPVVKTK